MLFGYARVSGANQSPSHQIDALARAGVEAENIHLDHSGSAKAARPQLDVVVRRLRSGDTLVITRLDRLGRSLLHLITLGAQLRDRGIEVKVLEQGIDTSTTEGQAMFRMLSVLAEFQHDLIVANTQDGLAAARARGKKSGRPPKLTDDHIALAQRLYNSGENTVAQIAAMLNVPRTTVYGHLDKKKSTATSGTGRSAAVSSDPGVAVRIPRTCPTCGYAPGTRAEAAHQRGDLAVAWLHPHDSNPGSVLVRSHCRHCEPEPPAFDVACTVCGDGPILAGAFAHAALHGDLPIPVQRWLTASGWNLAPSLLCPDHR
ncbi:recombinase family protein [Rhodococcus qingshengii]|uniref:recombinase family protein n=1 Tax=Rhodococcus qingshengii TaxID=334542 RepID=UPI001E5E09E9|nr:recombinase family protein [Rhodococcus qingshengii]MCD2135924.1 recombinase family protein [Rhodococcus qingshengii]